MGTFILVRCRSCGYSDIVGCVGFSLGIFFGYSSDISGSRLRVSSVLRVGYRLSPSQVFSLRIAVIASSGALMSAANVYPQFSMLRRYQQYLPHGSSSQVRGTLDIFRYWSGIGFLCLRIMCQVLLEVGVIGSSAGATDEYEYEEDFYLQFRAGRFFRQKIFCFEVVFRGYLRGGSKKKLRGEATLQFIGGQGYGLLEKFGRSIAWSVSWSMCCWCAGSYSSLGA